VEPGRGAIPGAVEWAYKIQTRFGPGLLESVYEAVPAPQLTEPSHEGMK